MKFASLNQNGTLSNVREVDQKTFARCPFHIFDPSHYRNDGSCKCNDPDERKKMIKDWGYKKSDFKNIPLIQS